MASPNAPKSLPNEELNMKTVEEAYQALAAEIIEFAGVNKWQSAGTNMRILSKMTESDYWRKDDGKVTRNDLFPPLSVAGPASHAALFLRDDLLKTTGDRIWGLTFTLYPTGKFAIEYDYDKPEGYEETDDVITGDEINASLANLTKKDAG